MIAHEEFGRTGHISSRVIFGGAALMEPRPDQAERVLRLLLEYGVNHIDTSTSYGQSERWIGMWMERYRDRFFLATKIDGRTRRESGDEFDRSLEKLRTDRVDLLQMHELVQDGDLEEVFAPEGALRTLEEAKASGRARFLGVTGHGPDAPKLLRECLRRYPFDSVLLPFTYPLSRDEEYLHDFAALQEACIERGVAVQTMKAIVRGEWDGENPDRDTWYRPLEEQEDIDLAVGWVLGNGGIFVCSPGDVELLPKFLDAARRFREPPSDPEMEAMRQRTGMSVPGHHAWPRLQLRK